MKPPKQKLVHLLVPKEFKVWCVSRKPSTTMLITMYPSKATCANCLTKMRTATTGNARDFKTYHVHPSRGQEGVE